MFSYSVHPPVAREQIRHRSKHRNTRRLGAHAEGITRKVDDATYSIALKIRHLVSLVQVLGDGCLATSCWSGNDPDVLVL